MSETPEAATIDDLSIWSDSKEWFFAPEFIGPHPLTRTFKRRAYLRTRDGDNCHWCTRPMSFDWTSPRDKRFATVEHLLPRSRGGTSQPGNLVLACRKCNVVRGNLADPTQFNLRMDRIAAEIKREKLRAEWQAKHQEQWERAKAECQAVEQRIREIGLDPGPFDPVELCP